jgi:Lung seven transmembrane receptor
MNFVGLWLLVLLPAAARSKITRFDLVLPATSEQLQFTQELLRAPGIIDLSDLKLTAVSDAEAYGFFSTSLDVQESRSSSVVDIVVFTVPSSYTRADCGWTTMGVGNSTFVNEYGGKTKTTRYCCNEEAIGWKLCHNASFGRLILDKDKFKGQHRFLEIPPGRKSFRDVPVPSGKLSQNKTGWYETVFANCNDNGRLVITEGTLVWQNIHGYLPGEYYGFCLFVIGVAATYSSLAVWYAYSIRIHESSPIEKWVLVTITLGALEMLALVACCGMWNRSGYRPDMLFYFVMLFSGFPGSPIAVPTSPAVVGMGRRSSKFGQAFPGSCCSRCQLHRSVGSSRLHRRNSDSKGQHASARPDTRSVAGRRKHFERNGTCHGHCVSCVDIACHFSYDAIP